jgi:hypothetical protein
MTFRAAGGDTIAAEAELKALRQALAIGRTPHTSKVRTGHAPNEISKAAKDLDVDLIVIATMAIPVGAISASAALPARRAHRAVSVLVVRKNTNLLTPVYDAQSTN